jgi:hypothetical protein
MKEVVEERGLGQLSTPPRLPAVAPRAERQARDRTEGAVPTAKAAAENTGRATVAGSLDRTTADGRTVGVPPRGAGDGAPRAPAAAEVGRAGSDEPPQKGRLDRAGGGCHPPSAHLVDLAAEDDEDDRRAHGGSGDSGEGCESSCANRMGFERAATAAARSPIMFGKENVLPFADGPSTSKAALLTKAMPSSPLALRTALQPLSADASRQR